MPYIPTTRRALYEPHLHMLVDTLLNQPDTARIGDLTYVIYCLLVRLCVPRTNFFGRAMLEAAARRATAEFARRHIDPYEDTKITENGDVT